MKDIPALYVSPQRRNYGAGDEGRLRSDLDDQMKHTMVVDVDSVDQLRLEKSGRTKAGDRFTSMGLKQVCNLLSLGLYRNIVDVAGVGRPSSAGRDEHSLELAIKTFNSQLALRCDARLAGKQRLLYHEKDRIIEGVLGPKYRLIENHSFFEKAEDAADTKEGNLRFHEGSLVGRRLSCRFVAKDVLFKANGDVFHDGLHFANSEIGGESTLRAAPLLWRAEDGSCAMGPFFGGRRHAHVGRNFEAKVGRLLALAASHSPDPGFLAKRLGEIRRESLGFPETADDNARRDHARSISRQIQEHDVTSQVAAGCVLDALYKGPGHAGYDFDFMLPAKVAASRTVYDLFVALAARGANLYSVTGEKVERVAHDLLTGRFKLK